MPLFTAAAPLLLILVLFLGPVLALAATRRWRLEEAKRDEIMRLAMLAAAEADRAEAESNFTCVWEKEIGYVAGDMSGEVVRPPQCEICYRPTTTRCSRCKAVRYCSGRCQIIHWRQGHKEGCQPPEVSSHCSEQARSSDRMGVQVERSVLFSSNVETGDGPYTVSPRTFFKKPASSESNCSSDDFSEDRFLFDTSGTESSPESTTMSSPSSCSTFSCPEPLNNSSASEDHVPQNLSSDNFPYSPKSYVSMEVKPPKIPVSGAGNANSPTRTARCLSNINHETSTVNLQKVESIFVCPPRLDTTSASTRICNKPPVNSGKYQDVSPGSYGAQKGGGGDPKISRVYQEDDQTYSKIGHSFDVDSPSGGAVLSKSRDPITINVYKSGCVSSGRSRKSSRVMPPSSVSNHHISSGEGDHFVASSTSLKSGPASTYPIRSQLTDSVHRDGNELKTSARAIVEKKIISSTYSKNQPSRLGSLVKCNTKIPSSYDLFIKFYNSDKVDLRPCGLTNCGNSCYANAVLQCLAFTRPFTAYLLQGIHSKACSKQKWCFTCEFESLLLKAKQGKSPLSPTGIISHIHDIGSNLGRGREEDAHEFLRYAIDAMEYVCLKEAGRNAVGHMTDEPTLVQLTFGGYLRSKIECMRCKRKSERLERLMDLTLEIHGDIGTLEDALLRFTATEILDGDNKYQCNRCKSYEPAKKKFTILEAPNILTIALKRFQSGKFGKINKTVRFPENLDLAPYMKESNDKSPYYKLYGVVVHLDVMNASFSGHYVCYVKDTHGKWYKIDDSMVKPVDLEKVLKQGAYMLFYARCSPRAPSMLRKAMVHDPGNTKSSGNTEVVSSGHPGESHSSNSNSRSTFVHHSSLFARHRIQEYHHLRSSDSASSGPFDLFTERFRSDTESYSDNSSLFSSSDGGSSGTDSTRDSSSEFSEYIFGESDKMSWNSPQRFSDDSDGFI